MASNDCQCVSVSDYMGVLVNKVVSALAICSYFVGNSYVAPSSDMGTEEVRG